MRPLNVIALIADSELAGGPSADRGVDYRKAAFPCLAERPFVFGGVSHVIISQA